MPYGTDAVRLRAFKGNFGSSRLTGAPATLYIALARHATDPGGTLGTEPDSTGNYARVAMSNADASFAFSANGGSNAAEIRYPVATAQYSITSALNQFIIYDNASGGTVVAFGALGTTITVTGAGDQPVIPANQLVLTERA